MNAVTAVKDNDARSLVECSSTLGCDIVAVYQKDGNTFILEPNGVKLLPFADRCPTLTNIPDDQGYTILPFSRASLMLWQEAVPVAAARSVPNVRQRPWGLPRVHDLCNVVQVAEFLRDDGVEAWAADCLANLLRKEIDPMWAHIGHEKRIHADMRPSLMPAVSRLHRNLQTAVLMGTGIPLSVLSCVVPEGMLAFIVQCSLTPSGTLDLSKQLARCSWGHSSAQSSAPPPAALKSPLAVLSTHISDLQNLRNLLLEGNEFTAVDAPYLAHIVSSRASFLRSLSLKQGNHGLFALRVDKSLWKSLQTCTQLTRLDFSYNNLSTAALDDMFQALGKLLALEALNVKACSLHDEQAELLCYNLSTLTRLKQLDLGYNSMGHLSFTQLARSVQSMTSLQDLNVTQSNPDLSGLMCLLASAASAPSMRSISAEECRVYSWIPQPAWPSPRVTRCTAGQILNDCIKAFSDSEVRATHLQSTLKAVSVESANEDAEADAGIPFSAESNIDEAPLSDSGITTSSSLKAHTVTQESTRLARIDRSLLPKPTSNLKRLNLRAALGSYLGPLSELMQLSITNLVMIENDETVDFDIASEAMLSRSSPDSAIRRGVFWRPVDILTSIEDLHAGSLSFLQVPSSLLASFFGSLPSLQDVNLEGSAFDPGALWDVFHTMGQKIEQKVAVGLTCLSLSGHPLTVGEVISVCRLSTLRKLSMKQCQIGARKASALGAQIHKITGLTCLDLSANSLESEGRSSIVVGISRLHSLRHLNLGSALWCDRDRDLQAGRGVFGDTVDYVLEGHGARSLDEDVW